MLLRKKTMWVHILRNYFNKLFIIVLKDIKYRNIVKYIVILLLCKILFTRII